MSRETVSAPRCLAVWAATTVMAGRVLTWLLPQLGDSVSSPPAGTGFEEWLVVGCEAAAAVGTGWLWLLVSLVSLEAAVATSRRHRGVPRAVRRLVLAACGVGLVGGLSVPSYAVVRPSPLDGLPLPDRPTTTPALTQPTPAAHHAPVTDGRARAQRPARTVRVAPGDTLWALAETDLPDAASDAEVDAHWRSIHAANREVIGDDPDLIRPGQQLRLPPATPST